MKPSDLLMGLFRRTGRFGAELKQTFQSLGNRNFRLYCAGQVVSLSGTWMQSLALSWLVYRLTGSAAALGMVSFASSLPLLLLPYLGGMIADRFDRKKILYTTLTLDMIQTGLLAYLTFSGMITVPLIILFAATGGIITALELPTRQALLPELVKREELTNAIGLNSAIWNTSRTIGPALAGVLVRLFGEALCFGINSVSFLASIITLKMISLQTVIANTSEASNEKATKEPGVLGVLFSPSIRYILMLSAATSMFGFQYGVLLPLIVDHNLGGDASTLGLLSASAGVGALIGSLALANRGGRSKGLRRGIGFACLTLSLAVVSIAYSPWLLLSMACTALAGASISIQLSGSTSIVQALVTDRQRGRVMGVFSTFMVGFTPIAAVVAGWLAELIGVQTTLVIAASSLASVALLYLFLSPAVPADDGNKTERK